MHQSLGLMSQALGLGGFVHFAAHPFSWMQTLGFRLKDIPSSQIGGGGFFLKTLLRPLGQDLLVPTAVGLERSGEVLIKPYCPPYYRPMEETILAFVEYKFAEEKVTFRDGGESPAWKDAVAVQADIPRYPDEAIAATIAYCEHIYSRYGRFPANIGLFRTVLACQVHHLDLDFYDRFYKPGTYTKTQSGERRE